MKHLILLFSLLLFSLIPVTFYSQANKAIYTITLENYNEEISNSPYYSYYKTAQENSNQFTFQLNLSKNRSDFFIVDNLEIENNSFRLVKAFSRYQGGISVYKNSLYIQKEIDNKTFILKENFEFEWNLTSETKKLEIMFVIRQQQIKLTLTKF